MMTMEKRRRRGNKRHWLTRFCPDQQNPRSPYLLTPYTILLWGTAAGMIDWPNPGPLQPQHTVLEISSAPIADRC